VPQASWTPVAAALGTNTLLVSFDTEIRTKLDTELNANFAISAPVDSGARAVAR
jgi:hypothetical protein